MTTMESPAEQPPHRPIGSSSFLRDLAAVPNLVSLSRVVFIYVTIGLFFSGHYVVGLVIGVLAGLTDYLDGYLARRLGQSTRIGGLIDQACDILFITGCIFMFVHDGTWPVVLLYIVLFRETVVLNLRASAAEMGFSLPSIFLGKVASNFMFWSLALMGVVKSNVLPPPFDEVALYLSHFGMIVGPILSLITGAIYLRSYARKYRPIASARAAAANVAHRGGDEVTDRGAGDDGQRVG